jgi:tripartite-type tricarboxylate transporter receptor subunit TctC
MLPRLLVRCAVTWSVAHVMAASAMADDKFPSRFITLIVPVAAGGPTDVLARRFAEPLSKAIGASVVVQNVTGAGGAIAYKRAIEAAPDGYTALLANVGLTSAPVVLSRPDLDPTEKLEPIGMIGLTPTTLTVRASIPASTAQEFLKYAKAQGDKLNMAHAGNGSGAHLNAVLFNAIAKLEPTYVPFQGAAPILTALTAGHVDAYLGLTSTDVPLHESGRVKILAVSVPKRLPSMPDVPTMSELGLADFNASVWFGLFLPKGVPDAVVAAYERALGEAVNDPVYRSTVEKDFVSVMPDKALTTRPAFAAFVKDEVAKWQTHLQGKLGKPQ